MVQRLENHMRWLVLLLLVPLAAGQNVLVAEADITEYLQPSKLLEFIPNNQIDTPIDQISAPGVGCGQNHFTFNDADKWFRYRETDDGVGCAEARYTIFSPPGTTSLGISFEADRDIRASSVNADPSFTQDVRLYPAEANAVQLDSREYYARAAAESNLQKFYLSMPLETNALSHVIAWHFEETGDGVSIAPTPVTSVSYTSSISNPAITHEGIQLASKESRGAIRVTEDTEFSESVIGVTVPDELFSFGEIKLRILLPASFRGIEVKTPSGQTLSEELVLNTVDTGIELILPANHVTESGIYEFKVVKQTALVKTPFMWPVAITAMVLPLVAGTFAIRETKRFKRNAGPSSFSTAQALDRGNIVASICIILLLGWLIFFQRVNLLTSLPVQLEGTLYYVLLAALAIGGFSIWFLTRYQLREIELDMERLQDLSEIKSQMIGTMSHELKTPLTPMKMELDMLESGLMGNLSSEQKESVTSIQSSLNRLSHLVSDILDVSKSDSGQLKIIPAPMDLVKLIGAVKTETRFTAKEKGVTVAYTGPAKLQVTADSVRISQVLTNLVDNAIKFTPPSGNVEITAIDEGSTVFFSVKDSGQGMPVDGLRRLFQPFGQIHADAKTNRTGTGLGLYICKGIIEGHGGTIRALSEGIGHGSTFEVRIPKN